jgi:hypothetical protein
MINSAGNYLIMRYDGGNAPPKQLWNGSSSAIHIGPHKKNRLQGIAQNSHFSFKINDQSALLAPGQTTLTDTTYTNGQPGLLITGPSASFIVTKVQLEIS